MTIIMLVVLQLSQSEADYNEPEHKTWSFPIILGGGRGERGEGREGKGREELILFMSLFSQDLSGQEKTFMGI